MEDVQTQTKSVRTLTWPFDSQKPLIIAGPCSAESEEQLLGTARQLSQIPEVSLFRAGIWKPRTRPNGFEGVGREGLGWLQTVKQQTGLPTAVVVWIGARTSVNPFSIKEIAGALAGVDIPVLVKNPVNPDINSWIGALERITQAGIKRLAAVHRGFSTIEKTPFRNAPKWELPVELMRLMPEIPVICDPSHIAGNRDAVAELSQIALDLAMSGLMIESHIEPDKALSDAQQQIKPETLHSIIKALKFRKPEGNGYNGIDVLNMLRREMDEVDQALLEILARRFDIAAKIGLYKKSHNMTILQVHRWQETVLDRIRKGKTYGLDETMVKNIWEILHKQSFQIQSDLLNRTD